MICPLYRKAKQGRKVETAGPPGLPPALAVALVALVASFSCSGWAHAHTRMKTQYHSCPSQFIFTVELVGKGEGNRLEVHAA
jgi:hypothetical protein